MAGKFRAEYAIALGLLLAAFFFPSLLKPYADTFAFGRSYAKLWGFALYACAAVFFAPIASGLKLRMPDLKKPLLLVLSALFLLGLFGQLHFMSIAGASPLNLLFAFGQSGYTVTSLVHIHASKVIFCAFLPDDNDLDCARPMLPYLPQPYQYIGLLLWLAAAFLSVAHYAKLESPSHKFLYIILSFSALRTSIDGGIFSYDVASFAMLSFFLLAEKRKLSAAVLGFPAGAAFSSFAPAVLFGYPLLNTAAQGLALLAFALPAAFALEDVKARFPLFFLSLASVLLLPPSYVVQDRWSDDFCQKAEVDYSYPVIVSGKTVPPCNFSASYQCGNMSSQDGGYVYSGFRAKKLPFLLAKSFSMQCSSGIFTVEQATLPNGLPANLTLD
ncbi:MAG: hypothetical protein QW568_04295 [Candidatus Anstonellaceae archaeon]